MTLNDTWLAIPILGACFFSLYYPLKKRDVFWVFLEPEDFVSDQKSLKEEKATLMLALKELDFDFEVGKLSKEDYKALREKYESQAISTMKQLEVVEVSWQNAQQKISQDLALLLTPKGEKL